MVKRRYATPVPPAVSGTVVGVTVPFGNCPAAATVQAALSGEVSTRYLPVLAVGPSPQVADGLITSSEMATATGSLITTCWPADATSEPQPVDCDWSINWIGPQPYAV
jgi:hypothetical protein